MGRKPADIWIYAVRMAGDRFRCKFCGKDFAGGAPRLRSHLSGTKRKGIQVCSKAPENAKNDALLAINGASKKKSKIATRSSNSDGGASSVISDASCSNDIDTLLAKFFGMDEIPFGIVESPSFSNLVNALIKSGSGYVLPSSSTLKNQLIPSLLREIEQYVTGARESWEEAGCTLVSAIWDNNSSSFLSVMACSGKRAVLLSTFAIPNNNLTEEFLEEVVHRVVQDVGTDKIVQYIVDDMPYTEMFSKLLAIKCPHVFTARCAILELQSLFKEVQQEVEWVRTTCKRAKCLVDALYKDDDLLALMGKYIGRKVLEQSLGYDMLESIFEVQDELDKLVHSPEWRASGYDQRENGKKATEIIASEEFWKQVGEAQLVLKPLSKILHLDDVSSFGYLYGLVEVTEEVIAHLQTNNRFKYQKLRDILQSKKGKIINVAHKVAAFLNPAYICNATVQEITQLEEGMNYILRNSVGDRADREAFVQQVVHYRETLSNPSICIKITAANDFTPRKWWNAFGNEFPILKKYAIRFLSQPCGSSSCKGSLSALQANMIKRWGFVPALNDLDARMNCVLMEKFNAYNASNRMRIDFEELAKHKSTNGSSDEVLAEARHSDEESRPLMITSEVFSRPRHLKLCFMTTIASPIRTSENVVGEKGCRIRVWLEDSATGCVVQVGTPSTLTLSLSVLEGDFTNEASTDERWTREYFDSNDLSSEMQPHVTGELQVILVQGEGVLGNFSFCHSSDDRRSGKFKLAVKSNTGNCEGVRILEGISNAFIVEDDEEIRTQTPAVHVDLPGGSSSFSIPESSFSAPELMDADSSMTDLATYYSPLMNSPVQGISQSLAQTTRRRVKNKALVWQSPSLPGTVKWGSQELLGKKERRGDEVLVLRRKVYSTGSNNVNQQEDGEETDKPMVALKGIDSLSSTTSAIVGNSIFPEPENSAMTLVGVRVTSSSGAKPTGETHEVQLPTHPSTALQLSLTGDGILKPGEVQSTSATNVNQQEDDEPMTLKVIDFLNSTASAIPGGCISVNPKSPAIMLFGVQVTSSGTEGRETHEIHSPTARVMPTTEVSKEIPDPGKKSMVFLRTFDTAEDSYDAAAEPLLEDNFKSDSSVKYIDTYCGTGTTEVETSSGSSKYEYDVFLSFRGSDTRRSFTDILYQAMTHQGIRVFRDDNEFQHGELIRDVLCRAIENSRMGIVVFSRTYASSRWGLDEIVTMLEKKKDIMPIYFGVTPDDVKLKTNLYTDDLARHETKYNKRLVEKWREALLMVAKIKRWELKNMSYSSLVDSVKQLIGVISSKLKAKEKYELQHFVEMEDRMKNALGFLDIESEDMRVLAIHGQRGIGKTILAKFIYNQISDKFDYSCFLKAVRGRGEPSMITKMGRIKSDFHGEKILVVLDGLDNSDYITNLIDTSWFGLGSRIIVTTRNRRILENIRDVLYYEVEGMDSERALNLFSKLVQEDDMLPKQNTGEIVQFRKLVQEDDMLRFNSGESIAYKELNLDHSVNYVKAKQNTGAVDGHAEGRNIVQLEKAIRDKRQNHILYRDKRAYERRKRWSNLTKRQI